MVGLIRLDQSPIEQSQGRSETLERPGLLSVPETSVCLSVIATWGALLLCFRTNYIELGLTCFQTVWACGQTGLPSHWELLSQETVRLSE